MIWKQKHIDVILSLFGLNTVANPVRSDVRLLVFIGSPLSGSFAGRENVTPLMDAGVYEFYIYNEDTYLQGRSVPLYTVL